MKYTSLFLDLDNTILDFNQAERVAITKVLRNFSLPFDEATVALYSKINKSYWERFERGEIPKSDIFEGRFVTLLERLGESRNTADIANDYFINLSEGCFKVDGAEAVLEYLRDSGYMLYATTNGISATQFKRVKNSGLEKYFHRVFVSEDTGHQKPEKEYFEYVIDNITEKDKRKMLIVGDSQSSDILGGINAGIDTCWYNPESAKGRYPATYEIKLITELKQIL